MSDTSAKMTAAINDASGNLVLAQSAPDLVRMAMFLGQAARAIDTAMQAGVDISPDPNATQQAFDNAKAGISA